MPEFELPVWEADATIRLWSKLNHRFMGAFWVPTIDHPKAKKEYTDHKIEPVEAQWEVSVREAPEDVEAAGQIVLDVICVEGAEHPFGGLGYRFELLREEADPPEETEEEVDPPPMAVRLKAVRNLLPPKDPDGDPEPGKALLELEEGPAFDPSQELGFPLDFPVLSHPFAPTTDPVETPLTPPLKRLDAVAATDAGVAHTLSCPFPAGPTIRTTVEWDEGEPWYRLLRKERVYHNPDGSEEAQFIAEIEMA